MHTIIRYEWDSDAQVVFRAKVMKPIICFEETSFQVPSVS
jgi:hypothetical protein